MQRIVARDLRTPVSARAVKARAQSSGATQSTAFFKTPTGIVVVAVIAAGAGYALYSASHDRIHSAGKQ